jgi:peptide deformylase
MKKALATQGDGVAIAAPQIGVSLRIFVVAGKVFHPVWQADGILPEGEKVEDLVYINPVITKLSKTKRWMHEGCLSVRPLWGEVERSINATVTAYDEHGHKFTRGAGGLLAHIFQHETDHLNGILFIDNARNVAPGIIPEKPKLKRTKKQEA